MIFRVLLLAALTAILSTGCCATGADDSDFTAETTQLHMPSN